MGGIVPPIWEDGIAEDIVASLVVFDGESQLEMGEVVVMESGGEVGRCRDGVGGWRRG